MEKKMFVVRLDNDGYKRVWCYISAYDYESACDKFRIFAESIAKSVKFNIKPCEIEDESEE